MPESTVCLGLDLATAGARVVAVDESGAPLVVQEAPLPAPVAPRPGYQEQEPGYLDAAMLLISRVTEALGPRAEEIRALSITGTSGSVVPCDAAGTPVSSALLYSDHRAGEEAALLRDAGVTATDTSPLARIGWLVRHRPADLYLHTPDVVAAGLLRSVPATDTSHALKAGIDPVSATWDEKGLATLGIDAESLPELVHPGATLGVVHPDVARSLGLPSGVSLVAGMTDGCTAQLAAGAARPGDTVGVLGTTLVFKSVSPARVRSEDGAVYSHYAPDGLWWPGAASNVGAKLVRDEFPGADLDALEQAAREHGPAGGVRFPLPGTGERFPFADPVASGFVVGEPATQAESYRLLLEGVAFTERLGLERLGGLGVRVARHRVVGGGSRNRLWNVIRATVLDMPVLRPRVTGSGYGAALLALAAYTGMPLAQVLQHVDADAETFEPDPRERDRLHDSYARLRHELVRRGYLNDKPTDQANDQEAT